LALLTQATEQQNLGLKISLMIVCFLKRFSILSSSWGLDDSIHKNEIKKVQKKIFRLLFIKKNVLRGIHGFHSMRCK